MIKILNIMKESKRIQIMVTGYFGGGDEKKVQFKFTSSVYLQLKTKKQKLYCKIHTFLTALRI